MTTDAIVILCAFPNADEAEKIARELLDQKLIACAHLPQPGRSLYRWKGKIEDASEIYALFKTTKAHYKSVEAAILKSHSYDVPAIMAFPAEAGYGAFLSWIADETQL